MFSYNSPSLFCDYILNSNVIFISVIGQDSPFPGGPQSGEINPSNAEATSVQSTRMQIFLKPCHVGIH